MKKFFEKTKNCKILLVWSTKSGRALLYYSLWWTDVTRTLYNLKRVDNATGELWLRQWPLCPWGALHAKVYVSFHRQWKHLSCVSRKKKGLNFNRFWMSLLNSSKDHGLAIIEWNFTWFLNFCKISFIWNSIDSSTRIFIVYNLKNKGVN